MLRLMRPRLSTANTGAFNHSRHVRLKFTARPKPRYNQLARPKPRYNEPAKVEDQHVPPGPITYRPRGKLTANVVTLSIITICTAIFLTPTVAAVYKAQALKKDVSAREVQVMIAREGYPLQVPFQRNMVTSRRNINEGRWWCLITSTFSHGSWLHLGCNMYTLWAIGRPLLMMYGFKPFASLWLLSGVGSNLAGIYWPDIVAAAKKNNLISSSRTLGGEYKGGSIGASGALCGIAGFLSILNPSIAVQSVLFAGFSVYCIADNAVPELGHVEHLFGLASGAAYWFLRLRTRRF